MKWRDINWNQQELIWIRETQWNQLKSRASTWNAIRYDLMKFNVIKWVQVRPGESKRDPSPQPTSYPSLIDLIGIYIYMYIYIYISRDRVTLGCIVRWAPLEKLIHAPRQGDRRLASWRHTLHSWYEKTEGGVPGEIPGDLQKKRRRTTQDS